MAVRYYKTTFILLALTADARSQFFDFYQGFDSFLQPYHTTRPAINRDPFASPFYVPAQSNRRTPQGQRNDSRQKNENNKSRNNTRKVSKTDRSTTRSVESFTSNPLPKVTKHNPPSHTFIDVIDNEQGNRQLVKETKTDSNKKQNDNQNRQKPPQEVTSRPKSTAQKQNRQESRRKHPQPIVPQNADDWELNSSVESDSVDHKKDKRVPFYDNNPLNNPNSFVKYEVTSSVPHQTNEIKYSFQNAEQNTNKHDYDEKSESPHVRPGDNQNRNQATRNQENEQIAHKPYVENIQNQNNKKPENIRGTQSSYKSHIYNENGGSRHVNNGRTTDISNGRPINYNNRPNTNEKTPINNVGTNQSPYNHPSNENIPKSVSNSGTTQNSNKRPNINNYKQNPSDRSPIDNAWTTERPYNKPKTNDRRPIYNEWTTKYPHETSISNQNRPYYNDRRPTNDGWTTQNPFHKPNNQYPYISGIVRPVGNENRAPITNRPPKFNRNPVTIYPTDDNITFPDDESIPSMTSGPDEDHMSEVDKRRYIELAERMCDKYKDLNTEHFAAIPLVPSPEPVAVNISKCVPTNVPLVVGGKVVSIQEFPHMALLGWKKTQGRGYSWKCGGTLVSDQYVLTAAHCSYQERDNSVSTGPPRVVQLGSSFLDDPGAIVMKVALAIRHPKYKLPSSYYDIALLKLANRVSFSERIKPACLGVPPGPRHPIIATGWGRTEFGGDQSHELRSVSLPIWRMDECWKVLGTSRKLPNGPSSDSQICAGEMAGGKDTCQGDSGGPAQIQDGCMWRVVAVTSVGRACGAARTPALYAIVQRAFVAAVAFGGRS